MARDLQILALAVGTLIALLLVANLTVAFIILRHVDDAIESNEQHTEFARAIDDAALNAKTVANHERGYMLSGDPEFLAEVDLFRELARDSFSDAIRSADDDAQHHAAAEAYDGFEQWLVAVERDFATYRAGKVDAATESSLGPTREMRKTYESALARARSLADDGVRDSSHSVSSSWSTSIVVLVAYTALALAIGIGIMVWLARSAVSAAGTMKRESTAP